MSIQHRVQYKFRVLAPTYGNVSVPVPHFVSIYD